MIFGLFILAVALTISAVAAYYSIAGLCAIFAAAVTPIIVMGAALELGKITATVWLHKYWHRCALQFKLYLVPAIIVLMVITSMGIFGFLSKAHMDQTVTVGDSAAQVQILDEKIKTEQDNIAANKRALQQMDAQVDQLLGRTTDDRGANRAVQVRKQQAKERKSIQADISAAQKRIAELQNERAPLAAQTRKIEAEVGPIKYIAALIYGDNPDANLLERAVRWVIILLVLVFDPLALVLILAAEQTIEWARADRKLKKAESHPEGWHQEWVPNTENPWHNEPKYELDDGQLTDAQIDEINRQANVRITPSTTLFDSEEEFFEHGKELARAIDSNNGKLPTRDFSADDYLESIEDAPANEDDSVAVEEPSVPVEIPADPDPIRPLPAPADDPEPIISTYHTHSIEIPDFGISEEETRESHAGFGTEFPQAPNKGDLFLRVDFLPSKLYKWNDKKWIEVDKEKTDHYAYDQMYIKHLIEKIDSGEYDVDLLTESERDQIQRYLNDTANKQ